MELISKESAIDVIKKSMYLIDAMEKIIRMPSIELKRGKWIRDGHHIRCDQCGMYICDTDREGDKIPNKFCPNCGSYNRGEINDQ